MQIFAVIYRHHHFHRMDFGSFSAAVHFQWSNLDISMSYKTSAPNKTCSMQMNKKNKKIAANCAMYFQLNCVSWLKTWQMVRATICECVEFEWMKYAYDSQTFNVVFEIGLLIHSLKYIYVMCLLFSFLFTDWWFVKSTNHGRLAHNIKKNFQTNTISSLPFSLTLSQLE